MTLIASAGEYHQVADPTFLQEGGPDARLPSLGAVMLIGGAPVDGERHIWWNFVSSSSARIEQAKRDWKEGRFPKVPEDEIESIPLPE